MVLYRTCLVTLVLSLLLADSAIPARRSACLTCHRLHYAGQGSCVGCHRGNDRTERQEIAHYDLIAGRFAHFTIPGSLVVKQGEKFLERLACRRCHIYAGKGNHLATNLDRLASIGVSRNIFASIKSPVLFMPNFHADDIQIAALVNAILARAKFVGPEEGESVQVVHFQDERPNQENVFAKQCGLCHKVLSEKFGGLGAEDVGPNLSGLFSEYYPKTYLDAEPWTPEKLRKWLKNPRNMRANARMKPVRLAVGEFELLLQTMLIPPETYPKVQADRKNPAAFRLR